MKPARFIIDSGIDGGREFEIDPGAGVRIGRSSNNDIPLKDPSISRFHCRIFSKQDGTVWASDLGSVNQTLVNNAPIHEIQITTGDRITIGDSVIRVAWDGVSVVPQPAPPPPLDPSERVDFTKELDLGLTEREPASPEKKKKARRLLLLVAVAVAGAAVLLIWLPKFGKDDLGKSNAVAKKTNDPLKASDLYLRYEKVDATSENIYRFYLVIDGGMASIEVDDLKNGRHFSKPLTPVADKLLVGLTADLQDTGVLDLQDEYSAKARGTYIFRDLTLSLRSKTYHTRVLNSPEPKIFEAARSLIEEFGINEFGIRAISRSREELLEMADEAYVLGRKLYQERRVRFENLFLANEALKESQIYIETIDPKPKFFEDVINLQRTCEEDLKKTYEDLRFQADRAMKMKEWREATDILQVIRATIPNRAHKWHKQAEIDFSEAQRRMEK